MSGAAPLCDTARFHKTKVSGTTKGEILSHTERKERCRRTMRGGEAGVALFMCLAEHRFRQSMECSSSGGGGETSFDRGHHQFHVQLTRHSSWRKTFSTAGRHNRDSRRKGRGREAGRRRMRRRQARRKEPPVRTTADTGRYIVYRGRTV